MITSTTIAGPHTFNLAVMSSQNLLRMASCRLSRIPYRARPIVALRGIIRQLHTVAAVPFMEQIVQAPVNRPVQQEFISMPDHLIGYFGSEGRGDIRLHSRRVYAYYKKAQQHRDATVR